MAGAKVDSVANRKLLPIPPADPLTGGELIITELTCEEAGTSLRGRFQIPRFSRLSDEQVIFLETFLRCRGMINSVEKELGISYPTVRARLDALLDTLQLQPVRERKPSPDASRAVLDQLEKGEITAEEAKAKLKEAK